MILVCWKGEYIGAVIVNSQLVPIAIYSVVGCVYCQNFHGQIPLAEPNDFTAISGMLLLFDQSTQSVLVNVSIADDMIFEGTEIFQASLTLVDPFIPAIITVSPSLANVSIEDDDSKSDSSIVLWMEST